jgi:hypothetical protein
VVFIELHDLLAIASEVLELEVPALILVTDLGLADSAASPPQASFGGEEFYPAIVDRSHRCPYHGGPP